MNNHQSTSRRLLMLMSIIAAGLILSNCTSPSQSAGQTSDTPTVQPTATSVPKSEDLATTEIDLPASPTASPTATVPSPVASPTPVPVVESCDPTPPDALGPFYVPGAPERASVGQGHLLQGTVRSSLDCAPIAGAKLEFWLAGPNGEYGDDYRATLYASEDGTYTFESNFPPPYSGRPAHIHLQVSAEGYDPLVTQYYPPANQTHGNFDLVLVPSAASADPPGEIASVLPDQAETEILAPTLFDVSWADRSPFVPGLIDSEQAVLADLPGATVYHLDLRIADDLVHLQGQQEVLYTNREDVPLNEIYFRLFPNLAGGSTQVSQLAVNGQPVEPSYELQDSALRIPLSPALSPGEQTVIRLEFTVEVPTSEGGNYGTFAFLDDVLALAHFYPLIPVYDDEGWNVEIAPKIGDIIYADTSFYLVRVTAPAAVTLVASGVEIERSKQNQQQVVTYAAGPVRDFYLAVSERYAVTSRTVGQTTVNSYTPADLSDGAAAALDYAVQALESFNTHFGPYPFTEFDLVSTTTSALGIEYPGIVAILVDLYQQKNDTRLMESVVAHEVAHQWFYSVVGNDQVDEPWLDEAMAQYATLLYYNDVYGPAGAAGFRGSLERRWERVNRADIAIGQPVRAYTAQEYSAIVYGRGPLFIETLAETMGSENFEAFMRDYYETYQWGIATGDDFKALAEQHCACELTSLFDEWVSKPSK